MELTQEEQIKLVKIDPLLIKDIDNPSKETIRYAMERNVKSILYLKKVPLEYFAYLARNNAKLLEKLTKEQVDEETILNYIGKYNVNKNAYKYFPYYTKQIIIKLIQVGHYQWGDFDSTDKEIMDAYVLKYPKEYIKHPCPDFEFCHQLITKDANNIVFIPNPSKEIQRCITMGYNQIKSDNFQKVIDEDVKKELIAANGRLFHLLKESEKTEEYARIALHSKTPSYEVVRYIPNLTKEEQNNIIKASFWNIQYIRNPLPDIQMIGVKGCADNISFIEEPTDEVVEYFFKKKRINAINNIFLPKKAQMYALDKNINAVKYFKRMHPEAQIKAIQMDADVIKHRNVWSEEAQLEAIKKNPAYMDFNNLERKKFTNYICKVYLAFEEKEGYKNYLEHFILQYFEEKSEEGKGLKDIPIESFKVLAESIYLLPVTSQKKAFIMTIEKNEKTHEQEQFWKEVKAFHR